MPRGARNSLVTGTLVCAALVLAYACGRDDGGGAGAVSVGRPDADHPEGATIDHENSERKAAFVVLALGASLTAGYGLDDPSLAWPALLQAKLDDAGIAATVVNSGESGRTTSGGVSTLNSGWVLRRKIDLLVIALGGNDGLRGVAVDVVEKNLVSMI